MAAENERPKILIVDDEEVNIDVLVSVLKPHYKTIIATDGEQALKRLEKSPLPDLVLLDVMMPGMDGHEVCRRLKSTSSTKGIPVIFLTVKGSADDIVAGFRLGAVDYITKPFQPEELSARVNTHLTIRSLQKELEARNRDLAKLANVDGLTQIANRRFFDIRLEQEWLRLAREQKELSLIIIDIDYFKDFNDYYGHQAGDDCLKQVAQVFDQAAKRPADLAARYGGEEFVILLSDTDQEGAEHIANGIHETLRQLQIPHAQSKVCSHVTCSMGIACMKPHRAFHVDRFVATADEALYLAKTQGRNQIVVKVVK